MKYSFALVALASSAQLASATFGWVDASKYSCPSNTDNQCTQPQKSGFDWTGLNLGSFNNYNSFNFNGFQCASTFDGKTKRDQITGRTFQNKCIKGRATPDKSTAPNFGCGSSKDVEKFSVSEFQVSVEFDCDLEFHYDMPDGSTCKQKASCKKSGTLVKNTQCGGAKNVHVTYPTYNGGGKSGCDVGFHHIGFDCSPPVSTKPIASTTPAKTTPAYTPPVYTPPVYTPPASSSTTTTSVKQETTPAYTPPASSSTTTTTTTTTSASPAGETTPAYTPPAGSSTTTTTTTLSASSAASSSTTSETPAGETTPAYTPPAESTTAQTSASTAPGSSSSSVSVPPFPVNGTTTTPAGSVSETTSAQGSTTLTTSQTSASTTAPGGVTSAPPAPVTTPSATLPYSSAPPAPTAPCPAVLPQCLNTWLFSSGCKSNTDKDCFCSSSEFVDVIYQCLAAHGASDEEVDAAQAYFQGICAVYVPSNPAIVTGVNTLTITVTAPVTVPVTTIQLITTVVVPCTETEGPSAGSPIPGSSTTTTISTTLTVPQVAFQTITGTAAAEVSLVQGIPQAAVTNPAAYPTPVQTTFSSVLNANGTAAPTSPIGFTGAGSKTAASFGTLFAAALMAFLIM